MRLNRGSTRQIGHAARAIISLRSGWPQRMAKKHSGKRGPRAPKTVLRLPDMGQARSAVLNSLSSTDAQRGARRLIDPVSVQMAD